MDPGAGANRALSTARRFSSCTTSASRAALDAAPGLVGWGDRGECASALALLPWLLLDAVALGSVKGSRVELTSSAAVFA